MPGLGQPELGRQGRMLSAPSPPACSAQSTSEQSSSSRQPLVNYQPTVSPGGQTNTSAPVAPLIRFFRNNKWRQVHEERKLVVEKVFNLLFSQHIGGKIELGR